MDNQVRPVDDPAMMTLTEAAARFGHSRIALRQRVRRGTLPSFKGNDGVVRVHLRDLSDLPPPDQTADDHEQPEVDAMVAALDVMRQTVDDLRSDRDRARTTLDEMRENLAQERMRAGLAEERAAAATARTTTVEARLATAEAALEEARTPFVIRMIRALRGNR